MGTALAPGHAQCALGDPPGECHLTGMGLTDWPWELPPDTVILHLDDNSIYYVPDGALLSLRNLEEINMEGNEISTVRHSMLAAGKKLIYINLGSNQIMFVHGSAFCETPELVFLALDNNRMTFLYPETFLCLTKLRTLLLQYNSLSYLEVPDGYNPPQSLSLAVYGNSLTCDRTRDSLSKIQHNLLPGPGGVTLNCRNSTAGRRSNDTIVRQSEGIHFMNFDFEFQNNTCTMQWRIFRRRKGRPHGPKFFIFNFLHFLGEKLVRY